MMLEKQIEKIVCDYAKGRGYLVFKFSSPARAAVPDRMFITPGGRVFFIEFKAEGKKPTPAQEREHARLRGHSIAVYVCDDAQRGKAWIDTLL